MSFAGDSGLDPRRPGVFESEGAFHLSNETGDLRAYWKNALEHLKIFWQSGGVVVGLQEMNKTENGAATGSGAVDTALKAIKPDTETDTLICPGGAKPGITIAWLTSVFGSRKDSKVYDLDYVHTQDGIPDKIPEEAKRKQAGRPIHLVLTDKNFLLINIHAPNMELASAGTFADFKQGFQTKLNQFISEVPDANSVPLEKVIVMGDFNDRYDALQELPITIGGNSGVLRYNGQAPLSCCHNWDSSCSDSRYVSKQLQGRERAGTCTPPAYPPGTMGGPDGKVDFSGKPYALAGPGPRVKMGDEGNIKNYRYTGDKIFVMTPSSDLTMVAPTNGEISSTRSDHEMVQMTATIPAAGGRRRKHRKTHKTTKRRRRFTRRA